MANVYAAFDSQRAVLSAIDQLQLFGFPRSAIRRDGDAPVGGIVSKVENFFARLGSSPSSADLYEETLRRGGAVLAVNTATAVEHQAAQEILRRAGSIDLVKYNARKENAPRVSQQSVAAEAPDIEAVDRQVAVGGLTLHRCCPESDSKRLGPIASEADFQSFRVGSYEVRALTEVISLTKTARVVEELSVNKAVSIYTETVRDTLRGTAVEIEEIPAASPATAACRLPT